MHANAYTYISASSLHSGMRSIARRIESGRASRARPEKQEERRRRRTERRGKSEKSRRTRTMECAGADANAKHSEAKKREEKRSEKKRRRQRRACTAVVNGNNCCGRCHSKARVPNARCQTVVRVITVITLYRDTRCIPADRCTVVVRASFTSRNAIHPPMQLGHLPDRPILTSPLQTSRAVSVHPSILQVAWLSLAHEKYRNAVQRYNPADQYFPSRPSLKKKAGLKVGQKDPRFNDPRLPVRTDNGRLAGR